ncbi:MAG TPA: NAD(P)/FAD-dependent oxidoreductase [Acidothermaceae bacterium]
MGDAPDAIVVGSGPNGLAAAITLADAGLRVHVYEGAAVPGGGARTEELTLPGFRHDVCSAAHPLALASPFFRRFNLQARGVRVLEPEVQFAHPLDGGRAGFVVRSVDETADGLGADAAAYRRWCGRSVRHADDVVDTVLSSLRRPPRHPLRVAGFGLAALEPASLMARHFGTDEMRGLLAGVAAHSMLRLSRPPSGAVALLLTTLGHSVGWPVIEGGSSSLVAAMVSAIEDAGGAVFTDRWVTSLDELPPTRAVLLDVTPRSLIELGGDRLPSAYRRALARFRYGAGVCKVDFALSGPVPWTADACRRAGTVHLGGTFEEVARSEDDVAAGRHPERPYVLAVQAGVVDPSRAPAGQHALWTYCHVPAGSTVDMSARIQAQIERFAPGFRDLVLAKAVRTAAQEEQHNPNYPGGDIASGAQTLRQTFARPALRWNPYRTGIPGVYLCSASTPPGAGVHGRCGELAAQTALREAFGASRTG